MDHLTVHSFSNCSSVSSSSTRSSRDRQVRRKSVRGHKSNVVAAHYPMVSSGIVFREGENPITQGLPPITRRYDAKTGKTD
ncbi:hypothetical protein X777_16168 [Ooceraea biroi]|uniref:Uncharacterized protein n=1 Tax=Ooceraea biroi TaxID=2015173 RepID=A0A026WV88_OOCBI|nr:hypothetical protein X777_16168 [Ooceraea biroi]